MTQILLDRKSEPSSVTRRKFLQNAAVAGMGASAFADSLSAQSKTPSSYVDLLRPPDRIVAYAGLGSAFPLAQQGGRWTGRSVEVDAVPNAGELPIRVAAPNDALTHLHLRWTAPVTSSSLLCLGDAWERSYGDLAWNSLMPQRPMPWYFATWDGSAAHCYGVRTGAKSLCFWQLDPEGVSLWLDVSNGGSGVLLGDRVLPAATVVARAGQPAESSLEALHRFCSQMCPAPRPSPGPVYGSNDWYYAYGNNSPEAILRDADLVVSLRPPNAPKPFTVIDGGWADNAKFPDMAALAVEIRRRGARPGIWERPLSAPNGTDPALLLPAGRFGARFSRAAELAFDPTTPEALQLITAKIKRIRSWGYDLLKHDFTTYDLLGQWGSEMGAQPTLPGWSFHDRGKTNAEIILDLYHRIRDASGEETLLLSCNVIGHLGAGIFDIQRTGDDTSGRIWERTRRMGINTLAFRMPQHGSFFVLDADCVAITQAVPWKLTQQWLDVVAHSGTALFVSPAAEATGGEQKKAIAAAFAAATAKETTSAPLNWFEDTTPASWIDRPSGEKSSYRWCEPDGAWPFAV